MAVCYDKHFEPKNRWQTQRISKHFKNQSNGWNDNYYTNNSYKSFKISPFDMKDHDKSIKSNNIPIWNCSRCTYRNIQRKSHCTLCNLSYKSSIITPSTKTSHTASHRKPKPSQTSSPSHTQPILADYCNGIMDKLNQSIPVWICNECTYCNIEQLPQCQMCLNPYSQNKQYINPQSYNQVNCEYVSAAEQQFILESVQCQKKAPKQPKPPKKRKKYNLNLLKTYQNNKSCQSMPENIINPIPDILAPGLASNKKPQTERKKFSVDQLMKYKLSKQCQSMPTNIINAIPDILAPGLSSKTDKNSTPKRARFSMNKLRGFQSDKDCQSMPENIIDPISEILAPGLGRKLTANLPKRARFSMEKLLKLRDNKGCTPMPDNIITEIPEILAVGLGKKSPTTTKVKRAKFSMHELMGYKEHESCQSMPDNVINDIPEILSPEIGRKSTITETPKRPKFTMHELMRYKQDKSCQAMPDNVINDIPEILSPGIGKKSSCKYTMNELKDLRFNEGYEEMPEHVMVDIPGILAPGLGAKLGVNRRKYGVDELKDLRFEDGYDSMPGNVIEDTPEILAPGLGIKQKQEVNNNCNVDEVVVDDDVDEDNDDLDALKVENLMHENKDNFCSHKAVKRMRHSMGFGAMLTMKLCQNNKRIPRLNYDRNIEGVSYHNLLECRLDIYELNRPYYHYNNKHVNYDEFRKISSTLFIPSSDNHSDLENITSIPIQYKYKYHLTEGHKILKDDNRLRLNYEPLQGIATQLMDMRYPVLSGWNSYFGVAANGKYPWFVDIPSHKYVDSPVRNYQLLHILMEYLPSKDVVKFIVFGYLGYDEVDIVQLSVNIESYIAMKKYKMSKQQRKLCIDNAGRLPFKIQETELNSVTEVGYGTTDRFTEIGFIAKQGFNNYFGRNRRNYYNHWREMEVYNKYTKSYYYRDRRANDAEILKKKEKEKEKYIGQFYPKKYFYLKYNGSGPRNTPRQQRKHRRRMKRCLKQKQKSLKYENDPRFNDWSFKRYWQSRNRYVQRKWSAYWKLENV